VCGSKIKMGRPIFGNTWKQRLAAQRCGHHAAPTGVKLPLSDEPKWHGVAPLTGSFRTTQNLPERRTSVRSAFGGKRGQPKHFSCSEQRRVGYNETDTQKRAQVRVQRYFKYIFTYL